MTKRVSIIQSSSAASTRPTWNDYELQHLEDLFLQKGIVQSVSGQFAVSQRGAGANMSVDIAAGVSLIEITNTNLSHGETYKVYFSSDAVENVTVPTADATNPRKDRIVLRVDVSIDPDGNSGNIAVIELLAGTPAGSPSAPATPGNAISLAIIDVPASDTSIENAQITDNRSYVQVASTVLQDIVRTGDLVSTANGKGASTVGVEDSGGNFTGVEVEAVLAELQTNIDVINPAPTGSMTMWTTDTPPASWLLCYGQAVSRTTYAALFAVVATTFGVGDGSTTFDLPDMRGRFPLGQDDMGGASANRVTNAQADSVGGSEGAETKDVSHTHAITRVSDQLPAGGGNIVRTNVTDTGGSASQDVMNPYLTLNFIIKT